VRVAELHDRKRSGCFAVAAAEKAAQLGAFRRPGEGSEFEEGAEAERHSGNAHELASIESHLRSFRRMELSTGFFHPAASYRV
jgi:hypothetical protein